MVDVTGDKGGVEMVDFNSSEDGAQRTADELRTLDEDVLVGYVYSHWGAREPQLQAMGHELQRRISTREIVASDELRKAITLAGEHSAQHAASLKWATWALVAATVVLAAVAIWNGVQAANQGNKVDLLVRSQEHTSNRITETNNEISLRLSEAVGLLRTAVTGGESESELEE